MIKTIIQNLSGTIVLAFLLSITGVYATRVTYWDIGLIACTVGIFLVISIETLKMIQFEYQPPVQTTKGRYNAIIAERRENLALFTLYLRSSLVAHCICAFFFFKELKEIGVIACLPWQKEFLSADVPIILFVILALLIWRIIGHIIFVCVLLARKNYFLI